jgi:hypothetical protein
MKERAFIYLLDRLKRSSKGASTLISIKNGRLMKHSTSSLVFRSIVTKLERQFCVTWSSNCEGVENESLSWRAFPHKNSESVRDEGSFGDPKDKNEIRVRPIMPFEKASTTSGIGLESEDVCSPGIISESCPNTPSFCATQIRSEL